MGTSPTTLVFGNRQKQKGKNDKMLRFKVVSAVSPLHMELSKVQISSNLLICAHLDLLPFQNVEIVVQIMK